MTAQRLKVSHMIAADTITGDEIVPILQGGVPRRTTVDEIGGGTIAENSQAEAEEGTVSTGRMTPRRVKDAIDFQVPLLSEIVENTQDEAETGTASTGRMTPRRTKNAIDEQTPDVAFTSYSGASTSSSNRARWSGHLDLEYDFGVVPGSATADFHTRMQAALDRAAATNVKEIWVPSGPFTAAGRMLFNGKMTITSSVRIIGKGKQRSNLVASSSTVGDDYFQIGTKASDSTPAEYISFENLSIIANNAQEYGAAINVCQVDRLDVINCRFASTKQALILGSGAQANAAASVFIQNCNFSANANSINLPVIELRSGGICNIYGAKQGGSATTQSGGAGTTHGTAYLIGQRQLDARTVTITQANPAVVTLTAHHLSPGTPFLLTTTGTLPTGLSLLTNYFIKDILTADTFTVAATEGGAAIETTGAGSGVHTIDASYGNFDGLEVTGLVSEQWARALSIEGSGVANMWIHDNIFDRASISMYIGPRSPATAQNIIIHDNVIGGPSDGWMRTGAYTGHSVASGVLAEASTGSPTGAIGIWIDKITSNALRQVSIHDNLFTDFGGSGVLAESGAKLVLVHDNTFEDVGFKGSPIVSFSADSGTVSNNHARVQVRAAGATYGLQWGGTSDRAKRLVGPNNWEAAQTDDETGAR
jgi:hypothetical protein